MSSSFAFKNRCGLRRRGLAIAALLAGSGLVGGCSLFTSRQHVEVTTHLAVLSVESFEDARTKLSPKFALTGDDALKLVNPTIGVDVRSRLDSLRASSEFAVDITPDSIGLADAGTPEVPALPGSAPSSAKFTSPGSFKDAQDQASPLRTSRALEYQLAQALFEQVAMLNATVAQAAVPKGYKGYIVQLQLGVMPRVRELDRDIFSDMAFFVVTKDAPQDNIARVESLQAQIKQLPSGSATRIRVIPLLSTDSLESVVNSGTEQQLRAISGGLRVAASRVSAGGSVESILDELRASLGKQLLSSYSIARLSENSLRARFGSMPIGQARFTAVPRTHKIPLLLLLPDDLVAALEANPEIELLASARTTLLDPTSGKPVAPATLDELAKESFVALVPYFTPLGRPAKLDGRNSADMKEVFGLVQSAQENDYGKFVERVKALGERVRQEYGEDVPPMIGSESPESVWIEVLGIVTKTQYTGARFTIAKPLLPDVKVPLNALVLDDGKTWTITLASIPAERIRPHQAALAFGGLTNIQPEVIAATQGGGAKLVFPTLAKVANGETGTLTLTVRTKKDVNGVVQTVSDPIGLTRVSVKPPPEDTKPLLTRSTNIINLANGAGQVVFAVDYKGLGDRKLPAIFLKFDHGSIVGNPTSEPANKCSKKSNSLIEVTGSCVITLSLTGIRPGDDVTITAVDADDKKLAVDSGTLEYEVLNP